MAAVAAAAPAAVYDWSPAAGTGNWNDGSNWVVYPNPDPATQAPGAADVVKFVTPGAAGFTVTVPTPTSVGGLLIDRPGVTLNVAAAGSLAVTGVGVIGTTALTLQSGTIDVAGRLTAGAASSNGLLTVASGGSASFKSLALGTGSVTNVFGTLNATDLSFTGGTLNGTVTLAGNNATNTRRLTLAGQNAAQAGNAAFVLQGGGEVYSTSGTVLGSGMTVTARATSGTPVAELKLLGGATNSGTITLAADSDVNGSFVSLGALSSPTNGTYFTLYNNGIVNLSGGSTGPNARQINGQFINSNNGTLNVGGGVTAVATQTLENGTGGTVNVAAGSSLTAREFRQSSSLSITNVAGTVTAADVYFTGGTINGTITLAGNNATNTRRLTLSGQTGAQAGNANFVLAGGGELYSTGGTVLGTGMTVTARATSGTPITELKLLGGATNNGTITLAADPGVDDSSVGIGALSSPTGVTYFTLYNNGTVNLSGGTPGTHARTINGPFFNSNNGTLNVGGGVTAVATQTLDNGTGGTITVAAGSSLTAREFRQAGSPAVTNVFGTLTATDVTFGSGTINGTITLAGYNATNTRRLTLSGQTAAQAGNPAFVLQGGGEVYSNSGGVVGAGMTVTAKATAGSPVADLKLLGGATNNGTITLAADAGVASSSMGLGALSSSTGGTYFTLTNNGVINLSGGTAGDHARAINSPLFNSNNGTLNVGGVSATAQLIENGIGGTVNVASGASLTAREFRQSGSPSVTNVFGTLTATDVMFTGGTINGTVTLAGNNATNTRRLTLSGQTGTAAGNAGFVLLGGGQVASSGSAAVGSGLTVTARATAATPLADLRLLGSSFFNYGTINLAADANAVNSVVTLGVQSAGSPASAFGTLGNVGVLNLTAGGNGSNVRVVRGTLQNEAAGTVNVATNAVFDAVKNGGTITLNAPATFNGILTNLAGGTLNFYVAPTLKAGLDNGGTLNARPGGASAGPLVLPYAIGGSGGVTQTDAGTAVLGGANTYAGATVVDDAQATLVATPAAYENVLANSGGLDVRAGAFVFDYDGESPAGRVGGLLRAATPGGFAAGQIRSTALADGLTLGYGDDGSNVTVKVTLPGDATLDGAVDFADFVALQSNFGGTAGRFDGGDFDYNGATDFADFVALQSRFGQSLDGRRVAVTARQVAVMNAFAAANAVPEPVGVAAVLAAGAALLRRRRVKTA